MVLYRPSSAQEIVYIRRPIATVTTIQVFGSADGYAVPGTEFGDDEEIMVSGSVTAQDAASLMMVRVEIWVNGVQVDTTPLYGYDGSTNYYQYNLGMLAEGDYTIEVKFPRQRVVPV